MHKNYPIDFFGKFFVIEKHRKYLIIWRFFYLQKKCVWNIIMHAISSKIWMRKFRREARKYHWNKTQWGLFLSNTLILGLLMHSTVINVWYLKHSWVQLYADVPLLCFAIYHTNISQQSKYFLKKPQMCVLLKIVNWLLRNEYDESLRNKIIKIILIINIIYLYNIKSY